MEESKAEKQNKTLKTILLLIMIPVVAGLSIAAYHFLTKSDSDEFASKDRKMNTVNRDAPYATNATPAPAASTNTNTATPAPATTTAPAAAPAASSVPFAGKWMMTGPTKTIYRFDNPKKVGTTEVGLMQTTVSTGKSYDSNYTIHNKGSNEFEANGSTYYWELSNGGRSLKLEEGGNVMYFDRIR